MKQNEEILSEFETIENSSKKIPKKLPVLPVRDVVLFPYMIFPLLIGRTSTLKAVSEGVSKDKYIFVTSQKNSKVEEPSFDDVYEYGTIARIVQVLRLPNNLLKVLVEGLFQGKIKKRYKNDEYHEAEIQVIKFDSFDSKNKTLNAHIRFATELFREYVKNEPGLPADILTAFDNIEDHTQKLFFAAANTRAEIPDKQRLLEATTMVDQYFQLGALLKTEIEMQSMEQEIGTKVNEQIHKTQRRYFIQEQIRILQNELGGDEEEPSSELAQIKEMIEKAEMPQHAKDKAMEEFERLKKTPTMSPEFSVNRNYLELLAQIPWKKTTIDNLDVNHVKNILDEDHFDAEKLQERFWNL
ncbi:hypothetical protein MASR1M45_31090 [Candidatus Kapaibacterium sp.]